MDPGVTVALIFGITGTGTGIWGLIQASNANHEADKANKLGRESNDLARQANNHANASVNSATQANEIAAEANSFARRADERAARLESVEFERRDVEWRSELLEGAYWTVRNIGLDSAHQVQIVLKADESVHQCTVTEMGHEASIRFDISKELWIAGAEPYRYQGPPGAMREVQRKVRLEQRISWRSQAGIWSVITAEARVPE